MIFDFSNSIDYTKAINYISQLKQGGKVVEIKEKRKKRTIKQNAYLHVLITLYAIELGYTLEEAKTHLKRSCSFMLYEKNDEKFLKKTSNLNTQELKEFIDWVRNYAGTHGVYLPTSEEYLVNQMIYDKEISLNQEYL